MPDQNQINQTEWSNPENWIGPEWLSIYFSKRDSRTWVPKQIPALGWTINLGQPAGLAWLLTTILALPLLILILCLLIQSC